MTASCSPSPVPIPQCSSSREDTAGAGHNPHHIVILFFLLIGLPQFETEPPRKHNLERRKTEIVVVFWITVTQVWVVRLQDFLCCQRQHENISGRGPPVVSILFLFVPQGLTTNKGALSTDVRADPNLMAGNKP